ncbi:MAG: ATPase, T2SS/T4P/T4SS family [Candidatus Omnitrophica bacterium]|nr:ATPase, T2SS/T4P/T4SS family [Candidatus Omnitrophota bacterium]
MSQLINALLKENLITAEQLEDAKDKQMGEKKPIHEVLCEMGFVKEEDVLNILSKVFGFQLLDIKKEKIDPSVVKMIPYDKAKKWGVFPLRKENEKIVVAMSDPLDVITIDEIRIMVNAEVKPILATKKDIANLCETHYQMDEAIYDIIKNIVEDTTIKIVEEKKVSEEFFDVSQIKGDASPIIRLVRLIIGDAIKGNASDIHIEPYQNFFGVRYRIDGYLKKVMKVPSKLFPQVVASIKVLARLDIAEHQKAQDGRAQAVVKDHSIDLRISIVPVIHGEKVVIRLLDKATAQVELSKLGMDQKDLKDFKETIALPQGMILVTGPTGSGKTTTLYAALNTIKNEKVNIITIEDPIEYLMDGITQIQLNPAKNVTFVTALRNVLRQDPNIILIGEIRDNETADIAFRASMTRHLVFSAIHTNNSIASISRLRNIGLEPYIISSSLSMIVAQRLVRVNCPHCKESYQPEDNLVGKFHSLIEAFKITDFFRGKGCQMCGYSGYSGRIAIYEVLKIDEEIKELINSNASEGEILVQAKKNGFKTLAENGMLKISQGITTLEEVNNVLEAAEERTPHEIKKGNLVEIEEIFEENKKNDDKKTKILTVDDEPDILKILNKRLTNAGYEVIQAKNGKQAIESAFKERPDLIIMDIMMPEMDGIEATKRIRAQLQTAAIPIIMLTAKKDKQSELKGIDVGADDYITKPFDNEKLIARIEMLLRRSR